MSKRVLVLSAKVGSGHLVAANALEQELAQREGITYANIDALEMTNDMFRTLANDLYMYLVKHTPHFVGWNYDRDDVPFSNEEIVRRAWTMMNAQQLVSYLKEFDPDITICTHFLPAQVVAQLLAQGDLHTTLSVVTTDYDFQGLWLPKMFTRFFVALEETRVQMIALGFDPERITVSGIPIDPTFAQPVNRAAVLAGYEIDPDRPLLLISAGAIGGGPTRDLVAQALHLEAALQIVVICGRNRKLRREVEALTFEQRERFRVLGFTRDMVNLVRCATLFVGKPGGLTTAECMAAGTPIVISTPTPGQEERNSDHLLEHGAAIRCNDAETFAFKINQLLHQPERLQRMQQAARQLGRPDAARVVIDTVLADTLAPERFSREEREEIAEAARGITVEPGSARIVALYEDHTGIPLGSVPVDQFRSFRRHITDANASDRTAMLNRERLELFRGLGADAELCNQLAARIDRDGSIQVRWVRL